MSAFIIQMECPDCDGQWTQMLVNETLPNIQDTRCDHGCGAKLTITSSKDRSLGKITIKSDSGKTIEIDMYGFAKGQCYNEAFDAMSKKKVGEVVHAWAKHPDGDEAWFTHAWYEHDGKVYDKTRHKEAVQIDEYYQMLEINEERVRRYSHSQFFHLAVELETYGPFDKTFFFGPLYYGNDPLDDVKEEKNQYI